MWTIETRILIVQGLARRAGGSGGVERIAGFWEVDQITAQRLGLESWFRAHSKARVKAHLLSIGYFPLTLGVSEL